MGRCWVANSSSFLVVSWPCRQVGCWFCFVGGVVRGVTFFVVTFGWVVGLTRNAWVHADCNGAIVSSVVYVVVTDVGVGAVVDCGVGWLGGACAGVRVVIWCLDFVLVGSTAVEVMRNDAVGCCNR